MNTEKLAKDDTLKYQFLRLDRPQNLSVASLNQLLKGKGVLENQGQAFSQAAATSGINEIYLIAHALIETGNGQSQLAKGANIVNNYVTTKSATKYHNVFGIAALTLIHYTMVLIMLSKLVGIQYLKRLLVVLNL